VTDLNKKTPNGASLDSLRLNDLIIPQIRQMLLDLLSQYQELERPANPELLKLHIEASEDKILATILATVSKHLPEKFDPFNFVEPCEPECLPERHAYHQGQWDMAVRIDTAITEMETKLTPTDKE